MKLLKAWPSDFPDISSKFFDEFFSPQLYWCFSISYNFKQAPITILYKCPGACTFLPGSYWARQAKWRQNSVHGISVKCFQTGPIVEFSEDEKFWIGARLFCHLQLMQESFFSQLLWFYECCLLNSCGVGKQRIDTLQHKTQQSLPLLSVSWINTPRIVSGFG